MYFNNTQLLQSTLLPYFDSPYPLIILNKQFSKLNYEKYNTPLQPHGILETYYIETKTIYTSKTYRNSVLNGISKIWDEIVY